MVDRYPLQWPLGYVRTASRKSSQFKQTMDRAQRFLHDEVKRMGAIELIVSTNIPVRKDGMMYADYMGRKIDDPGVAIYFKYKGKDIVMCCDQYHSVWENIYALGKGIESLRGMERWGVSDFLERAFTGFNALPPKSASKTWWELLGYQQKPGNAVWDWEGIVAQYKSLAKKYHPDAGGDTEMFQLVNNAYQQARKEYGQ